MNRSLSGGGQDPDARGDETDLSLWPWISSGLPPRVSAAKWRASRSLIVRIVTTPSTRASRPEISFGRKNP